MPLEPTLESLPMWLQIVLAAGAFVGTAAGLGYRQYLRGLSGEAKAPAQQVVLERASIADMKPVHDIASDLHAILLAIEEQARRYGEVLKLLSIISGDAKAIREFWEEQVAQREGEAMDARMRSIIAETLAQRPQRVRRRTKTKV